MHNPIDLNTTPVLNTGTLIKSGAPYALVSLSAAHIPQILALQAAAFASLSEQEQNFLLKKDQAFFEKHFAAGGSVLGVVHDGQLTAQSVIVNPSASHPKTGMVDMNLSAPLDKITILQGVVVHPEYQGNRLMAVMIDAWLDNAKKTGRTHAIAEVAIANHFSWTVGMKQGLQIHSLGTDPADGTVVYNLHARLAAKPPKSLTAAFNKASVKCKSNDIAAQKKLLAEGYKGVRFDAANATIEFRRFRKPRNPPHLP